MKYKPPIGTDIHGTPLRPVNVMKYYSLTELPEADESRYKRMALVSNGNTDKLYICIKQEGQYVWTDIFTAVESSEEEDLHDIIEAIDQLRIDLDRIEGDYVTHPELDPIYDELERLDEVKLEDADIAELRITVSEIEHILTSEGVIPEPLTDLITRRELYEILGSEFDPDDYVTHPELNDAIEDFLESSEIEARWIEDPEDKEEGQYLRFNGEEWVADDIQELDLYKIKQKSISGDEPFEYNSTTGVSVMPTVNDFSDENIGDTVWAIGTLNDGTIVDVFSGAVESWTTPHAAPWLVDYGYTSGEQYYYVLLQGALVRTDLGSPISIASYNGNVFAEWANTPGGEPEFVDKLWVCRVDDDELVNYSDILYAIWRDKDYLKKYILKGNELYFSNTKEVIAKQNLVAQGSDSVEFLNSGCILYADRDYVLLSGFMDQHHNLDLLKSTSYSAAGGAVEIEFEPAFSSEVADHIKLHFDVGMNYVSFTDGLGNPIPTGGMFRRNFQLFEVLVPENEVKYGDIYDAIANTKRVLATNLTTYILQLLQDLHIESEIFQIHGNGNTSITVAATDLGGRPLGIWKNIYHAQINFYYNGVKVVDDLSWVDNDPVNPTATIITTAFDLPMSSSDTLMIEVLTISSTV